MPAIILPERCDRSVVEALLPQFSDAMTKGPLEIDASGVTQVGQVLLQLLASARRSSSGWGVTITPSPALLDAAELSGLSAHLFDEDI
ncbi:MAG: STAS domain-containing protein [Novosphingobium sp.]|nr:STAS domain-containing protein [Novosphingobium sp.]